VTDKPSASELILRWQAEREQGRALSPEELCAASPELLDEVQHQIEAMLSMEGMLGIKPTPMIGASNRETAVQGSPGDPGSPAVAVGPGDFPGYELLEELGRGGMGVVWKARQQSVNRIVAFKIVLASRHASLAEKVRFQIEAEAVAHLSHPNIVRLYEAGEHDGVPFFSLELCEGGSLEKKLKQQRPTPAEAAALVETLARAMQHAHSRGVVHRDLKPGNVLLAADGTPKIADFGLAKRLDVEHNVSGSGVVLGTASYMAPEQARSQSRDVGPAADVWALGAILYECLTGKPPFLGASTYDTLLQLLQREPPRPRALNPRVPLDLETICLKCLEKDPARRYGSAAELAEDLRRFLEGRPVQARPVGALGRAGRWCRRNPVVAALLAAVVLSLAIGSGLSITFGLEALARAGDAERRRQETEQANGQLVEETIRANRGEANERQLRVELSDELLQKEWSLYRNQNELLFFRDWRDHNLARAADLRDSCRWDFCHWEHRYLSRLCDPSVWSAPEGPLAAAGLVFAPDGTRLVGMLAPNTPPVPGKPDPAGELRVWDARTGDELLALKGEGGRMLALAVSGDGRSLWTACQDQQLRKWSVEGRKLEGSVPFPGPARQVQLTPDGKFLLVQLSTPSEQKDLAERQLLVVESAAGKVARGLLPWSERCSNVAISADGRFVAAAVNQPPSFPPPPGAPLGKVVAWAVDGGKEVGSWQGLPGMVTALAFSPDGRFLAGGWPGGGLKLWDMTAGRELHTWMGHANTVYCLAFRPDGKRFASTSAQIFSPAEIKVWETETAAEVGALRGHPQTVRSLAFSPDGQTLASGGIDGIVKLWDAAGGQQRKPPELRAWLRGPPPSRALSPSGRWVLHGEPGVYLAKPPLPDLTPPPKTGTLDLWRISGPTVQRTHRLEVPGAVSCTAFGPDDSTVAAGLVNPDAGPGGTVRVWSISREQTPREEGSFSGRSGPARRLAFDREGGRLAAVFGDDRTEVRVWERGGKRDPLELRGHRGAVACLAFSPDGRTLLGGQRAQLCFWDLETGEVRRSARLPSGDVSCLLFSPDGRQLYVGSTDGMLRILNPETGAVLASRRAHAAGVSGLMIGVTGLAFSHDGQRLISQGSAGSIGANEVKLWAVSPFQEVFALPVDGGSSGVAFDAEDRYLLALDLGNLHIWDAGPAASLQRRKLDVPLLGLACAPGAESALVVAGDGTARLQSLVTGNEVRRWGGLSRLVPVAALSPDGKLLAGGVSRNPDAEGKKAISVDTVAIWDTASGKEVAGLPASMSDLGSVPVRSKVWARLAFNREGTLLAVAERDVEKGGMVRIWDVSAAGDQPPTEKLRLTNLAAPATTCIAFSHDSRQLLIAGTDGSLQVRNVQDGTEALRLDGRPGAVLAAGFSPDGRYLVSIAERRTDPLPNNWRDELTVWDARSGARVYAVQEPWLAGFAFDRTGRLLATAGKDVQVRDIAASKVLAVLRGDKEGIESAVFGPEDGTVLAGGRDGLLRVWKWRGAR
jgi:WD40 repeat protein/tRNA A-37 threonylcarbamoyl transferase component Bud32